LEITPSATRHRLLRAIKHEAFGLQLAATTTVPGRVQDVPRFHIMRLLMRVSPVPLNHRCVGCRVSSLLALMACVMAESSAARLRRRGTEGRVGKEWPGEGGRELSDLAGCYTGARAWRHGGSERRAAAGRMLRGQGCHVGEERKSSEGVCDPVMTRTPLPQPSRGYRLPRRNAAQAERDEIRRRLCFWALFVLTSPLPTQFEQERPCSSMGQVPRPAEVSSHK